MQNVYGKTKNMIEGGTMVLAEARKIYQPLTLTAEQLNKVSTHSHPLLHTYTHGATCTHTAFLRYTSG